MANSYSVSGNRGFIPFAGRDKRQLSTRPSTLSSRTKSARSPRSMKLVQSLLGEAPGLNTQTQLSVSSRSSTIDDVSSDSLKSMISQMQGIANAAAHTDNPFQRTALTEEYDTIYKKVVSLAKSTGFPDENVVINKPKSPMRVATSLKDTNKPIVNPVFRSKPTTQITQIPQEAEPPTPAEELTPVDTSQVVPEFKIIIDDAGVQQLVPVVPDEPTAENVETAVAVEQTATPQEPARSQTQFSQTSTVTRNIASHDPTPEYSTTLVSATSTRSGHEDDYGIGLKRSAEFNHFATRDDLTDAIINMNDVITKIGSDFRGLDTQQNRFKVSPGMRMRQTFTSSKIAIFRSGSIALANLKPAKLISTIRTILAQKRITSLLNRTYSIASESAISQLLGLA